MVQIQYQKEQFQEEYQGFLYFQQVQLLDILIDMFYFQKSFYLLKVKLQEQLQQ